MKISAKFKSYNPDQLFLLPPDMKDWLPKDLRFKESRLKRIEEAKRALEEETRRFRQFSFRGLDHCQAEWDLVCLTHNLLKLFRHGRWQPQSA